MHYTCFNCVHYIRFICAPVNESHTFAGAKVILFFDITKKITIFFRKKTAWRLKDKRKKPSKRRYLHSIGAVVWPRLCWKNKSINDCKLICLSILYKADIVVALGYHTYSYILPWWWWIYQGQVLWFGVKPAIPTIPIVGWSLQLRLYPHVGREFL